MCGIVGVVGAGANAAGDLLQMLEPLSHRGPDATAVSAELGGARLGAVRLAIVDPEHSHQPLQRGAHTLVFNGEIYNYEELRRELCGRGHRFSTQGDGEVILHLYAEDPANFITRLDGMFAFALWDAERGQLLLARDRVGIKPLYHWSNGETLVFASELSSLVRHPAVPVRLDPRGLADYFAYRFTIAPRTMLTDVRKLPAGCCLVRAHGRTRVREYWAPRAMEPSAAEDFGSLLRDAVESTCGGEGPLGVFLSSGLDSGAVAAFAAPGRALHSYTVGYDVGSGEDERDGAAELARELGTTHHASVLEASRVPSLLDAVVSHLDEPIYSTVLASTFELARAAKARGRVVLTGDGSDEVLLGYEYMARSFRKLESGASWPGAYAAEVGWLVPEAGPLVARDLPPPSDVLLEAPGKGPLDKMRWFELKHRLPDYHFARVDRMTMAHGIEARVPFVRNQILDWSASQDPRALLGAGAEKASLRGLCHVLPQGVRTRPKRPFTSPTNAWLQSSLRPEVEALLHDSESLRDLGLNAPAVAKLSQAFFGGEEWRWRPTWGVYILAKWYGTMRSWPKARA